MSILRSIAKRALARQPSGIVGGDLLTVINSRFDQIEQKLNFISAQVSEIRSLVGPFAATFPDGSMLTQTIHGVKYFVDPDDLIITPQMVVYRQWEADLSQVFRNICSPNTVIVDVGANFGYFSILGANIIGKSGSGQVFAFEPNPKLASLVRRNIEVNWSMAPINFVEAAVSDFLGEVNLHIPVGHGANASLPAPEEMDCNTQLVPVVRLDDCLPTDIQVDLMKIDVEGHEAGVLRGAQAVISRSPNLHLVMEWSKSQMRQAGVEPEEIIRLLDGFIPYRIEIDSDPFDNPESFDWLISQEYTDVLFRRPR